MQNIKALYHIYKAGDTGYKLCKDGSPACAGYAHIKHQNEQQIKADIEYARNNQNDNGGF